MQYLLQHQGITENYAMYRSYIRQLTETSLLTSTTGRVTTMADAESSHTDKAMSTDTDSSKYNSIMDDKSGSDQGTAAGEKSNKR